MVRIDVHREHISQRAVKTFREAIGLRVVGSRCAMNNTARAEELLYDVGQKHTASVAQQFPWCTMTEYEMAQYEGRDVTSPSRREWSCFCVSREMVDRDNYPAIASNRARKRSIKVDPNAFKRAGRTW